MAHTTNYVIYSPILTQIKLHGLINSLIINACNLGFVVQGTSTIIVPVPVPPVSAEVVGAAVVPDDVGFGAEVTAVNGQTEPTYT